MEGKPFFVKEQIEGSFAANGVKHCIRPMDMTGKSAAFILRQMHLPARSDSLLYSEKVDLPMHLSTLSLEDEAVPYFVQKRLESEENMNGTSKRGPKPKDNMKVQPPNFEANTLVDEKLTIQNQPISEVVNNWNSGERQQEQCLAGIAG